MSIYVIIALIIFAILMVASTQDIEELRAKQRVVRDRIALHKNRSNKK